MKVSDYIVDFLIEKGVSDVFGYPGGMVTHLIDSFEKRKNEITAHVNYHEQGAAFAACGYAQASGRVGVAYATSGPGATNLITGICHAWFDSVPVLFITGQVNTYEARGEYKVRQRGFQETNIVEMVQEVTKRSLCIESTEEVTKELERAWTIAQEGRKGPVLIDIPMNILKSDIEVEKYVGGSGTEPQKYSEPCKCEKHRDFAEILNALERSKRPCIVAGAGVRGEKCRELFGKVTAKLNVPVVTSMIAVDLLGNAGKWGYGFIGAYGTRTANFIVAKSDLIVTLGARLDVRQVGGKRSDFAPNAKIIRVDIDKNELEYQIRPEETDIWADAFDVLKYLDDNWKQPETYFKEWQMVCDTIQTTLTGVDDSKANRLVQLLSRQLPNDSIITTDVGQNQVWVAQSFLVRSGTRILFSGGHGSMGFSLPAAIGAYYGTGKLVFSFNGDGGFQMNMQELQFLVREKIPVKVFVFNNYALGMIRHFQEMYFGGAYAQTVEGNGYTVPALDRLAGAYGLDYYRYESEEEIDGAFLRDNRPAIIEVCLNESTYVYPKLEFGKTNQDQEPLLDRGIFEELMNL